MTDRAVSDTVGFVLVFGLVTVVVAISLTAGIAGLESAQQAEQTNNVERAFDVLAHNFESIHQRQAPSRATEMRLAGGNLGFDESTTITVQDGENNLTPTPIYPTPVIYTDQSGTEIAYEGGAIIRTDGETSVMLNEPPFIIGDNHTMVTVVRTSESPTSQAGLDGETTVQITGSGPPQGSQTATYTADEEPFNITVESSRADAWKRYFDDQEIGTVVVAEDDKIVYQFETDKLSIVRTRISVSIS